MNWSMQVPTDDGFYMSGAVENGRIYFANLVYIFQGTIHAVTSSAHSEPDDDPFQYDVWYFGPITFDPDAEK